MQGGSFRFGKKSQGDASRTGQQDGPSKVTQPPSQQTLIHLLSSSQKVADHPFSVSWPSPSGAFVYVLSVTSFSVQRDRKGWGAGSAGDVQLGEPLWSLVKESEDERSELWSMRSSDTALILTLIAPEQFENAAGAESTIVPVDQQVSGSNTIVQPRTAGQIQDSNAPPGSLQQQAQTWSTPPTAEANAATLLLSGNLNEIELPNVLQSIGLCKMTGKLSVYKNPLQVEVYFAEGELVHAASTHAFFGNGGSSGAQVVLDLFTWGEGGFQFQPGWKPPQQTITRRLSSLLLEGATLTDYKAALDKLELDPTSILCLSSDAAGQSMTEWETRFQEGLPLHLDKQKLVLEQLRGQRASLESLLETIPMPDCVWIPVVFNLITQKLVTIHGDQLREEAEFANIDDLIATTYQALVGPSGLVNYGLCLMLARSEFSRFEYGRSPFAIAIIDLEVSGRELAPSAMRKMGECFDEVSKDIDTLAQCNSTRLIAFLPHTEPHEAVKTIEEFLQRLSMTALDSVVHGGSLNAKAGVACVPRDGNELRKILNQSCRFRRAATAANPVVSGIGS